MNVRGDLSIHLLDQIKQITHHLEDVYAAGPNPALGSLQVLASLSDAFKQALNSLLQVATYGDIELFANHHVEIAAGGLMHVIQGSE